MCRWSTCFLSWVGGSLSRQDSFSFCKTHPTFVGFYLPKTPCTALEQKVPAFGFPNQTRLRCWHQISGAGAADSGEGRVVEDSGPKPLSLRVEPIGGCNSAVRGLVQGFIFLFQEGLFIGVSPAFPPLPTYFPMDHLRPTCKVCPPRGRVSF